MPGFAQQLFMGMGRVSHGNDANTVSLLHCDGVNGGTLFTDSALGSSSGHTWTPHAAAVTDTSMKQFGTAAGKFTGSNSDYIETSASNDFRFGSVILRSNSGSTSPAWQRSADCFLMPTTS
jgi:hypothetical protein